MRATEFIIETAMMGKIADSGKIIRILKKAHTVPFSDEKNWLLVDTDPGKGNSGLGIKWIPADTRFEWVRPYKDTVDENLSPQTIHKLADRKGVKWDNEPSFLQLTKRLTGKEHLDDLDHSGLNKVKRHLDGLQGVTEGSLNEFAQGNGGDDGEAFNPGLAKMAQEHGFTKGFELADGASLATAFKITEWDQQFGGLYKQHFVQGFKKGRIDKINFNNKQYNLNLKLMKDGSIRHGEQGVAEGQEHLDRIRSLSGLGEATKLPAQTRDLDSQEFQDYMKRIVGTPDLDKAGNVKVDKKGNEKYTTGKTKTDKYKMPYIHRSSVVTYLSPDGQTYDEDAVKKTLSIRPKALLKQNEKMKHSNGEFEQFFNVGFAALVGIALDEQTNKLIVVNTCPGAGSCKVECFAMKGGKIQFKAAWQSDGRILTYLLNDPDGFFNQLSNEISVESQAAAKGDKKFPNGWQTTVRWHDAGDFFSPEYLDLALKMAAKHPDVRFYAYTKMAGAALAKKPPNFIINWSEGANTTQEKQVKAQDPNLDKTKNSRIVPEKLFYDLLAKDEKGNLKKTADGAWQPASPEALAQMKQRIANEYGISVSSILSYTEYMSKRSSIPTGMKYNVIVAPGEGDVSANDPGVLSTLLLRH